MTPNEFRTAVNTRLLPSFPDLADYVRGLPAQTKDAWCEMFAGIEVEDLHAAIAGALIGDFTINAYERERTATILLRESRDRRDRRRDFERRAFKQQEVAGMAHARSLAEAMAERLDGLGCRQALREILQRVEAGENADDVTDDVLSRMA